MKLEKVIVKEELHTPMKMSRDIDDRLPYEASPFREQKQNELSMLVS